MAEKLQKNGYKILHRNYYALGKEIDIIASKNNIVYFVEVKSRFDKTCKKSFTPSDNITYHKRNQIAKAAQYWFVQQGKEFESSFMIAEVNLFTNDVTLFEDFLV